MQYSAIKPDRNVNSEHQIREIEYFQGFYPESMKELQSYVIAECDKMDYPNSPMYDEFPDRVVINQVCCNICDKIPEEMEARLWGGSSSAAQGMVFDDTEVEEVEAYEVLKGQQVEARRPWGPPPWGPPPGQRPPGGPPPWGPPPGQRPPGGPPPWGPPPGQRPPGGPPPWGPPPGQRPPGGPPPWGPPPGQRPPGGQGKPKWMNDIVKILLLNEMQRRRCKSGRCF